MSVGLGTNSYGPQSLLLGGVSIQRPQHAADLMHRDGRSLARRRQHARSSEGATAERFLLLGLGSDTERGIFLALTVIVQIMRSVPQLPRRRLQNTAMHKRCVHRCGNRLSNTVASVQIATAHPHGRTSSARSRGFLPWGLSEACPHTSPGTASSPHMGRRPTTLNNSGRSCIFRKRQDSGHSRCRCCSVH